MATVLVLPGRAEIEVEPGESLLAAAQRQGWWWPTVCQGNCECGTCWLVVEEGAEHTSAIRPAERERLAMGMKASEPRARLACQLRVSGAVVVSRRSVRAAAREGESV